MLIPHRIGFIQQMSLLKSVCYFEEHRNVIILSKNILSKYKTVFCDGYHKF